MAKDLATVDKLSALSSGSTVLVEENGSIQRAALSALAAAQQDATVEAVMAAMSRVRIRAKEACTIKVDGKDVTLEKGKTYVLHPTTSWDPSYASDANIGKIVYLDVSKWDVSNFTSLSRAFHSCSSLTTLDVSGFDTSKVTNMGGMFYSCSSLTTLDVSGFDTSKVTNMGNMFYSCRSLTTLIGSHTLAEVEAGEVTALNGTKVALDLSSCTKLDRKSLLAVIKGLADLTGATAQTLTLGSTLLALLTDADKKIATDKNWTLA